MEEGPDWKRKAEALEEELERTRDLVDALVAVVPVTEAIRLLASSDTNVVVLPLGDRSSVPVPADVKRELERAWRSIRIGSPGC